MIQIVAAVLGVPSANESIKYVLGIKENDKFFMPWSVPSDLQHFKKVTQNTTLIMGYNTWVSIGMRMLPGRPHVIVTRKPELRQSEVNTHKDLSFMSLENAIKLTEDTDKNFSVCGGGEIYQQFVEADLVDKAVLTTINTSLRSCLWGKNKQEEEIEQAELIVFPNVKKLLQTHKMSENRYVSPGPKDECGFSVITLVKN